MRGRAQTADELSIEPAKFHTVFTGDLSPTQTDVLAASQRPVAAIALTEPAGPAAWKDLPSWAAVGTADNAIGADAVRSMAQHANTDILEIDGSHVIMISQPDAVTDVIRRALDDLS